MVAAEREKAPGRRDYYFTKVPECLSVSSFVPVGPTTFSEVEV